jgi:predicted dehydrogenase
MMPAPDKTQRRLAGLLRQLRPASQAAASPPTPPAATLPAVRFAIVGAGMISQLHAAVIQATEGAELAAVYSRDLGRAAAITDVYGGDPSADLAAVLARTDVDAVAVCTASGEHAQFGVQAAEAGKHVLVEKPIDTTLEKADELIRACEVAMVGRVI